MIANQSVTMSTGWDAAVDLTIKLDFGDFRHDAERISQSQRLETSKQRHRERRS